MRPSSTPVFIPGPAGPLEGALSLPPDPRGRALLCHPHPLLGGTMNHKVVLHLLRALEARVWAALRFNFRGVGHSAGHHDEARGEVADALAALDTLVAAAPAGPLLVGGYSFGSYTGLKAASTRPEVDLRVAVAPPLDLYDFDFLAGDPRPVLFVVGEHDPICMPDRAHAVARGLPNARVAVCPDVDHLFHAAGPDIRAALTAFLDEVG